MWVELMEDYAFEGEGGNHERHLKTAFEAGRDIGRDSVARLGIDMLLEAGLDFHFSRNMKTAIHSHGRREKLKL
jgi:hypothetical protein